MNALYMSSQYRECYFSSREGAVFSPVDLRAFGSGMPLIVGPHRGTAEHTDIASHRGRDANGVMSSERVEANRLSSYQSD